MINTNPIIVIEDDVDDLQLLTDSFADFNILNKMIHFTSGREAIDHISQTNEQPLFILCDVNLPKQNGIELKKEMDSIEKIKSMKIPFVFYSTHVSKYAVNQAFDNVCVQGYFQKNDTFTEFSNVIRTIYNYWALSKHVTQY